jgi:hypothetical protein
MPRVVHFEIPADDPDRAVKFYEEVFGWEINRWEGPVDYWLITSGEEEAGINGAITGRDQLKSTVNTIEVPSVDDCTEKIVGAGGKVVTPKMAIPGVGYHSYCMDTEGNLFGVMRSDPTAQ